MQLWEPTPPIQMKIDPNFSYEYSTRFLGYEPPYIYIWLYWLVVLTVLKNISQWEGLSHILWQTKNVWNHQPDHDLPMNNGSFGKLLRFPLALKSTFWCRKFSESGSVHHSSRHSQWFYRGWHHIVGIENRPLDIIPKPSHWRTVSWVMSYISAWGTGYTHLVGGFNHLEQY